MAARNEHACDTHPFFTSPSSFPTSPCSPLFEYVRRLRRRGLAAFAAAYPNCGKQKKLSCVYDMRHNFAFFLLFYFASQRAQKCKTTALPRAEAAGCRMTTRKQYPLTAFGHPSGRDSRGETSSWAQQPAGAYYFMIRRHTHCLSPGIALTLLIISDAAGNIGWIQPFGIGSVGLKGWERICRIFAISCLLCDCMSALETTGQN
jgi:hypothetical protein